MTNTYTWRINQLEAKIQEDGLENVIYTVHYTFNAEDDSEDPIIRSVIGSVPVIYNPENPFIPYSELTKDDVIGWLESELDVDNMKILLDEQIELVKNPVDEILTPDWDSPIPPN